MRRALLGCSGALLAACVSAPLPQGPPAVSDLSKRWELERDSTQEAYHIRAHRQNYVLLGRWSDDPNQELVDAAAGTSTPLELDPVELEFQLSLKFKLLEQTWLGGDLWAAYTQLSHWQAYNFDESAPFRETNYEPEVIWTLPLDYELAGVRTRLLNLAFVHQSNGRTEPLSRSWNRLYAQLGLERGALSLLVRGWYRIPESSSDDNNPDIEDYLGHGDVLGVWRHGPHMFSLLARNTLDFDEYRGAVQLDWSFPVNSGLRGYVQLFSGYGETLVDYDHSQNTIGFGFILTDWL